MLEDIDFSDMVKTARAYIDSKLVGMDEREQEVFLGQLDKVIARHLTADEKQRRHKYQIQESQRRYAEKYPKKPRNPDNQYYTNLKKCKAELEATKMLLSEALKEIKRLTYRRY